MRIKDYMELAKRSLKIRKKTNRSTVIGLSLGFALLIPVIASLFGVNVSLNNQLNKTPYLLYYETSMSDYRIDTTDYAENNSINISGSKHIDYLKNKDNVEHAIFYEQYPLSSMPDYNIKPMDISVDSGAFNPINYRDESYYSIIDVGKSDSLFPRNLTEYVDGGIFLKGYDRGFDGDGKQQIVLSENFIIDNNLLPQDIYLKPLTVKVDGKLNITEDGLTEAQGFLCYNYTVVGIIKSNIADMYDSKNFMGSQMFFTSASVYDADGKAVLKPYYFRYGKKEYERYLVFDNFDNRETLNKEYMMLGWNMPGWFNKTHNLSTFGSTGIFGECDGYAQLNKEINGLNAYFAKAVGAVNDYVEGSPIYIKYQLVFNITNIVTLVLLIASLVLGMSALLNMFCSISHNVRERKQYLTMMRAIGAKDNAIPRLYMTESAILCSKAAVTITVVGFLLSMAVKLIFDSVLKQHKVSYNLSMPWWVIIATTLAVVAVVYIIGISFSYLCTKRLSKQKITSILNNE